MQPAWRSPSRRLILALLVVLGVSGLTTLWLRARSGAGIDFYQMWVGARVARDTPDFYAPATAARVGEEYLHRATVEEPSARRLAVAQYRRQLELVSTPFLYTLYAPFRGTYERDLFLFQAASLLALYAAFALFARTSRYGPILAFTLFAILTIAFAPTATDLRVANVNAFVLLLLACAAALTLRRRLLIAGAILGVAALAKPYLVLVFALTYGVWLLHRRWRDLGAHVTGAALAGLAGFGVSALYFRSAHIWIEWLRALRAMPQSMVPLDLGNFALTQIARDLWGVRLSLPVTVVALLLALLVACRTKRIDAEVDLLAIGLGSVIGLLASPLVWVHYLVMALPLIAWLLRPADAEERPAHTRARRIAAGIALVLVAVEPWDQFVPATLQVAALVNLGLLLAFAAGLFDLAAKERA